MINTEKSKRLDGQLYYNQDPLLLEEHLNVQMLLHQYNHLPPNKRKKRRKLLKQILNHPPKDACIEQPFHCDFGYNIHIGSHFYSNYNLTILDVGKVIIGDHTMFAPNVSIYTAGHPIHPESRNSGYEYGISVTIGNNVWLGGNVVVVPGVHIGNDVVIGAGSVVTKDIPDRVLAAGNPCRVIREITEEDRKYYYRDREFDVDDY